MKGSRKEEVNLPSGLEDGSDNIDHPHTSSDEDISSIPIATAPPLDYVSHSFFNQQPPVALAWAVLAEDHIEAINHHYDSREYNHDHTMLMIDHQDRVNRDHCWRGCDNVDDHLEATGVSTVSQQGEEDVATTVAAVLAPRIVNTRQQDADMLRKKGEETCDTLVVHRIVRAVDLMVSKEKLMSVITEEEQPADFICKLSILGSTGCGKTSFLYRGMDSTFTMEYPSYTASVDFKLRLYDLVDPEDSVYSKIKVQIWDTCGQERSRPLALYYYRNSHGVFLCYSVYDRQSYNSLPTFLEQIRTYGQHNPCILLLGLQADVKPMSQQEVGCYRYSHHHRRKTGSELKALERAVSYEEGEAFARSHGLLFMEVSSKDDFQIQDAIVSLVYMVLRRVKREGMRYVAHRPAERGRDGGFGRSGNEAMSKQGQRCVVS